MYNTQLTEEQKRMAVNMAMIIECGTVNLDDVLDILSQDRRTTEAIVTFWSQYNKMTQRALQTIVAHKCRHFLENCLDKEAESYPKDER